MRKVSSRNQRSKGLKAKHVLQICVLLGVCIWLIYQVKFSNDKKKEFEEKDAKLQKITPQRGYEIIRLGRKDLPNEQEVFNNDRREEEDEGEEADGTVIEEENAGGDEETKHDDESDEHHDELEKETSKHDDDEQEEEEDEEEGNKHGENDGDVVEKETSKHDEKEDEEEERENKDEEEDGNEQEVEDDDAQDGGNEVIEEHDQIKSGETDRFDIAIDREDDEDESKLNGELENKKNHDEIDKSTHEAQEENYKADDASSAVSHENELVNSETEKARNIMEVRPEMKDNSTVILETSDSEKDARKGVLVDLSLSRNATEAAQTPGNAVPNVTIPVNTQTSDVLTGQPLNLSSNAASSLPDEMKNSNSTVEAEDYPDLSSKTASLMNFESSRHESTNQTMDTVEDDPIDSSDALISHEEREEVLSDPDTLHDIRTEDDIEEIAAE